MKRLLLTAALAAIGTMGANAAVLIAGWDFQTTTSGGTAIAVAPGAPSVYTANVGTGTLYLDGTNSSSTWVTATTGNEVTSFGGSAINAGAGMSTTTTGAASLALLGGAGGTAANGKAIVFKLTLATTTDLALTYTTQGTATGFNLQTWSYSTNGGTSFIALGTNTPTTAFSTGGTAGVITMPTVTGLAAGTVLFKLVETGASNATGNNRFDNFQFNDVTAVPEPSTFALLGLGLAGLAVLRRKQKNVKA